MSPPADRIRKLVCMFRRLPQLRKILGRLVNPVPERPKGKAPTRNDFVARLQEFQDVPSVEIDQLEDEYGFAADRSWIDHLALHTQIVLKESEANWSHGRLLYCLLSHRLDSLEQEESCNILDTGTARGYSALVMARAILDSGKPGNVFSLDILPHHDKVFSNCIDGVDGAVSRREIWAQWPLESSRVIPLTGPTSQNLRALNIPRVCFAFLDAQHEFESVMEEYEWVSASQEPGDMIVLDDVSYELFPGVWRAFEEIRKAGLYATKTLSSSDSRTYGIATRV